MSPQETLRSKVNEVLKRGADEEVELREVMRAFKAVDNGVGWPRYAIDADGNVLRWVASEYDGGYTNTGIFIDYLKPISQQPEDVLTKLIELIS